jgi:hypothetical protein
MTGVRDVTYEVRHRGAEDQDLDVFFALINKLADLEIVGASQTIARSR